MFFRTFSRDLNLVQEHTSTLASSAGFAETREQSRDLLAIYSTCSLYCIPTLLKADRALSKFLICVVLIKKSVYI